MSSHNSWIVQIALLVQSCACHVVPPTQLVGKPAATCVEDETVDSSGRFCCVLHHELALRLVSSTLPAVGTALPPSVGPLSFTSCRFALLPAVGPLFSPAVGPLFSVPLIINHPTSAVDCVSLFHRGFAQRLSITFATLLVRVLLIASREPLFSTSCSRVHVLTHVSSSSRRCPMCCAWYAGCFPAALLFRALRVGLLTCTEQKRLSCESESCWSFARDTPATSTVCWTAVVTVWAWMSHVAISLVVHSCARTSARLRSCIENQASEAAVSLRGCIKLLPWRLGVHPAKAWSSDTPVRPRPSALTPTIFSIACGCVPHRQWAPLDARLH